MAIRYTLIWLVHHAAWTTDYFVEWFNFAAAGVADLELWGWEGAETAIAVEAEVVFKVGAAGVGGAAFVVGDGDFLFGFDVTESMDGFALRVIVPIVLSIWKTAVVDAAYGREDPANHGVRT